MLNVTLTNLYVYFVLLPRLNTFGVSVTVIIIIMLCLSLFVLLMGYLNNELPEEVWPHIKRTIKFLTISLILGCILQLAPDKDEVKYLVGGYVVANNEEVAKLPNNILGAVNSYLEEFKGGTTDTK